MQHYDNFIVPIGCEAKGLHVSHDMAAIEQPLHCRPSCFNSFNPWAGLYEPHHPFRSGQCPKRESEQQTTEKSDDNPFVLSADEQECVQNIGGAVASFLNPYGINVDVGVAGVSKNGKYVYYTGANYYHMDGRKGGLWAADFEGVHRTLI